MICGRFLNNTGLKGVPKSVLDARRLSTIERARAPYACKMTSALLALVVSCACSSSTVPSCPGRSTPVLNPTSPSQSHESPIQNTAPTPSTEQLPDNLIEDRLRDALIVESWREAATLAQSLPPARATSADMRLIRARLALTQGDPQDALSLLDGVDTELPVLANDVRFYRAEAQAKQGDLNQARRFLSVQTNPLMQVRSARVWLRLNQLQDAQRALDAAARKAPSPGLAREIRSLRSLASSTSDPPALKPPPDEDRGTSTPSPAIQRARAMALYASRSDYQKAAALFEALATKEKYAPESLYWSARAWSRADQNDRAVQTFRLVARTYPNTRWADHAAYHAARIAWMEARWTAADEAYEAYLRRYPRGMHVQDAKYERALCLLFSDKPSPARKLFIELARSASAHTDAVSLTYLAAVAAHRDGQEQAAVQAWNDIVQRDPLTWTALASLSRLRAAHSEPPSTAVDLRRAIPTAFVVPLPEPAHVLHQLGLARDAQDALWDSEPKILRAYAGRSTQALCSIYTQLSVAKRGFQIATSGIVSAGLALPSTAQELWTWDCLYPKPYANRVAALEHAHSIPSGLVHAVMRQESAFDPDVVSPAGAIGLMQVMPSTASKVADEASLAFDPQELHTPWLNLELGSRYLAKLLRLFDGNIPVSVAAYNAGPIAAGRWLARASSLPVDLWVAQIPYKETRRYVLEVMSNLARYRFLYERDIDPSLVHFDVPSAVQLPEDVY